MLGPLRSAFDVVGLSISGSTASTDPKSEPMTTFGSLFGQSDTKESSKGPTTFSGPNTGLITMA